MTYNTLHSQEMHETQSGIMLLINYHYSEVDNMVQRWRTYHAGRFIHKIDIYKWLIMTRKALIIQIINMPIGLQLLDIN